MYDDLVGDVWWEFEFSAFANGVDHNATHPLAGLIVNRLRNSGMSDDAIRSALCKRDKAKAAALPSQHQCQD